MPPRGGLPQCQKIVPCLKLVPEILPVEVLPVEVLPVEMLPGNASHGIAAWRRFQEAFPVVERLPVELLPVE